MDVGIIGAGIAGLAAAIALRRSGHTVEVFERSKFSNEVGAAIALPPNAARILQNWGFDFDKAQAVPERLMRFAGSHDLKVLMESSYDDCKEKYGSHWYNMHRADIHQQLKELAEDAEGEGPPAKIRLASEVTDVDFEKTIIKTEEAEFSKDLIIVADGTHSRHLEGINGKPVPMYSSGMIFYRALVPMEKVLEHPEVGQMWRAPPGFTLILDFATKYLTVTYPCRNETLLNVVFLRPSTDGEKGVHEDEWHCPSSGEEMKSWLKGTAHHQTWYDFFGLTDEVKKFQLMLHDHLDRLYRGNVVAIGDAAHPMLPTHAEGTGMGFEDAAALGEIFSKHAKPEETEARLRLYQDIRYPRSMVVQMMSNNRLNEIPHAEQEERARAFGYHGKLPEDNAMYFKQDFRDFFYPYDIKVECGKAMKVAGLE